MKIVCRDRRQKSARLAPEGRAVSSVAADIDRLLSPKSYEELEVLEAQISQKMKLKEPIDVDYWEQLLRSLTVWKAQAKLKKVYQAVIEGRLHTLRQQQQEEAALVREKLAPLIDGLASAANGTGTQSIPIDEAMDPKDFEVEDSQAVDPEPLLQLRTEDKSLEILDEKEFLYRVVCGLRDRHRFLLQWLICCRAPKDGRSRRWASCR